MSEHEAVESGPARFLFTTCQVGAESALKREVSRKLPALRFAYSRPGFLTFKLPAEHDVDDDARQCVFARAWGQTLGQAAGDSVDARAAQAWQLAGEPAYQALHVWQRDVARPGHRGFVPHITPAAIQAEMAIRRHGPEDDSTGRTALARNAKPGDRVLDCVIVEPDQWWIGWHRASDAESCIPGGLRQVEMPPHAVSRAYAKMVEALAWSALPIAPNDRTVELGCAPGGASQALLDHGLQVLGIDPAKVDPRVLENERFTHVQKRAADVRRRDFRNVRWLAADMNVDPGTALDAVEAIVTHPSVSIRGMLITLKLLDWKLADAMDDYVRRVREWGYANVRVRQLAHNGQEVCLSAQRAAKKRSRKRSPIKRRRGKRRD